MNEIEKIELARNLLYNAANMNMSKEIILKISQQLDIYIIDYYEKNSTLKSSHENEFDLCINS